MKTALPDLLQDVRIEAYVDAKYDVEDVNKLIPMIFVHGHSVNAAFYSGLLREYASHGFVVFGINMHDTSCMYTETEAGEQLWFDSTFPISDVEKYKVAHKKRQNQIRQLIDEIQQPDYLQKTLGFPPGVTLDMQRLIINGHSFGGITSIASAVEDKRIKLSLSLDPAFTPVMHENFDEYHLTSATPHQSVVSERYENRQVPYIDQKKVQSQFYGASATAGCKLERIIMLTHGHSNCCDISALSPLIVRILERTGFVSWSVRRMCSEYMLYAALQLKFLEDNGFSNKLINMQAVNNKIRQHVSLVHQVTKN